jgi:hypothetical protein
LIGSSTDTINSIIRERPQENLILAGQFAVFSCF